MYGCELMYIPGGGKKIWDSATVACAVAKAGNTNVRLEFNGQVLVVSPDDTDEKVIERYWKGRISYEGGVALDF